MCRYRVNKHLIVLNLYSVCHGMYYCESFAESKYDLKCVNTLKSTT